MYIDIEKLLERIPDSARCLDLGGWDKVFPRANVVADLNPWETRRNLYPEMKEQFGKEDWIRADFCSPAFWNGIKDKEFDFITIGHTLEDIRDPLYVCSQMIRCSHAGYIEVPSKMRECSKESATAPFAGYDHHRWLVEPSRNLDGLTFKAKLAWASDTDYLGDERRHLLQDYFHQFDAYFWSGSFAYSELMPKGTVLERQELNWYFENRIEVGRQRVNIFDLTPNSSSPNDGDCVFAGDYELGSEFDSSTGQEYYEYQQYL